jgi:hypothetical protein
MALNFSESNLEKSGSELIEYKSEGFWIKSDSVLSPINQEEF